MNRPNACTLSARVINGHAGLVRVGLALCSGRGGGPPGELGFRVRTRREDTRYVVRVLVQALGTEQRETFFGMPPVQGGLLPISLPQLTLYCSRWLHAVFRGYL